MKDATDHEQQSATAATPGLRRRPGWKRWLWHGLSLLLAAGLLGLLLGRQDWHRLAAMTRAVSAGWLSAALAMAGAYWALRTARWRWMAGQEGVRLPWPAAAVSLLAALGIGLVTPLRSGEVLRPLFIPAGRRLALAGWVVVERLFDLSAVLCLCLAGLAYASMSGLKLAGGSSLPPALLVAAPLLLAGALAGPLVLRFRPRPLWRLLERLLPAKARQLAELRLTWGQFAIFAAISLLAEVLSILTVYCCLRAFGPAPLWPVLALTPVVMLHNLLPATPGGFGVREGLAVAVFGAFGFAESAVLAGYLLNGLTVLVLPGCLGVLAAWALGLRRRAVALEQTNAA